MGSGWRSRVAAPRAAGPRCRKQPSLGSKFRYIKPDKLQSRASLTRAFKGTIGEMNAGWAARTTKRAGLSTSEGALREVYGHVVDETAGHFDDAGQAQASVRSRRREAIGGHSGYAVARIANEFGIAKPGIEAAKPIAKHLAKVADRGGNATPEEMMSVARQVAAHLAPGQAEVQQQIVHKLVKEEGWILGEWGYGDFDTAMSLTYGDASNAARAHAAKIGFTQADFHELTAWVERTPLDKIQKAVESPTTRTEALASVVGAGAHLAYAQTKGHQGRKEIVEGKSGTSGKAEDRLRAAEIASYQDALTISGDPSDSRIVPNAAAIDLYGMLGAKKL